MNFEYNQKQTIYKKGMVGYNTFRIPVIIKAKNGDILAFAEARADGEFDYGRIDIVLRRSSDGGKTWGDIELVVSDGANTCGNQCPIVDSKTGKITLIYCTNLAMGYEKLIMQGIAPRDVWMTSSIDNGYSWAKPVCINSQVKPDDWTWYATGPCHGIELKSGRYIIPCNHSDLEHNTTTRSHIIYSDDKGETWHIGGMCEWNTNESTVASCKDGLYLNMRSKLFGLERASARSTDEGMSFTPSVAEDKLIDPFCQGSVLEYKDGLLFCNAAAENRTNLTLRYSTNAPRAWSDGIVLESGCAAYSDMVADGETVLVMYETGQESPYESICIASLKGE